MTDDKKKKKRRRKKREEEKRGTSRMFYFHLHDNESFREGRKEGGSELIRLERAKFRIRRLSQRVGIIKTTEGKCFRAGGKG